MLTLHLPFPPSVNHYWRSVVRGGKVAPYVSAEGKAYRKAVKRALGKDRAAGRIADPITGRVSVQVALYAPSRVDYDIDNRLKGLFDALTDAGVWLDDKLVDRLEVERGEVVAGGSCTIVIRPRVCASA